MSAEDDDVAVAAREDAELASGFTDKAPPRPGKPEAPKAKPEATEPAKPAPRAEPIEFVQVTKKDWDEVRAAAAKTSSYDAQLSKAFGTIGNMQRVVTQLQAQTAAGRKVEIPANAFAEMERDFPELAKMNRLALEAALSGVSGTGGGAEVDPNKIEAMLATHTAKRELEALEDAYPAWREIVGAVDVSRQAPDPRHPFRAWLATKDVAYQNRINASESAAVIGRAIRLFQSETQGGRTRLPPGPPQAADPRIQARAARIAGAVQPRGDNAGAAAGPGADDEFLAGFNSR